MVKKHSFHWILIWFNKIIKLSFDLIFIFFKNWRLISTKWVFLIILIIKWTFGFIQVVRFLKWLVKRVINRFDLLIDWCLIKWFFLLDGFYIFNINYGFNLRVLFFLFNLTLIWWIINLILLFLRGIIYCRLVITLYLVTRVCIIHNWFFSIKFD